MEKNPGPAPTSRTFNFSFFGALLNKIFSQASLLKEWKRLLTDDGHVVYFDANQYLHLFDEKQKELVEEDMKKMEILFNQKYEVTPEIEHLENIARKLVLSNKVRPAWDVKALKECGYNVIKVEEDMGRYVWDEKQKVEQKSRPLFMVVAK